MAERLDHNEPNPNKSGDPECKPIRRFGEKKSAFTGHMDDLSEAMNLMRRVSPAA
ncbi:MULTISPECIES: hypothetical protein [unclassified Pseudomonas]|uniref:hypothetical protein n=1 Tax=unclassified Pseudomonas TaxID=196821 RepID=UPI001304EEE2|nr:MULTISPECIES: hypothetical protein [unclassified Pseudomonas]